MTEPLSRAISAYEHCASEADRRAETHEALAEKDAGHALASRSLRSLSQVMRDCADALRSDSDYAAALKGAVEND